MHSLVGLKHSFPRRPPDLSGGLLCTSLHFTSLLERVLCLLARPIRGTTVALLGLSP
jgi:hypothetical protein